MAAPKPPGRKENALTSDSAGMLIISFLCIWQFLAVMNSIEDYLFVGPAHFFDFLHPSVGAAVPWLAIAMVCIVSAAWKKLQPLAVGLSVGIHFLWGVSYIAGWLAGVADDSWIFATGYFATVILILFAVGRGRAEHGHFGGDVE